MANQIIIDIGAAANDGTGDPLRTAFNYVNNNFSNVWNTGLPESNVVFSGNRILTSNTNGNLVLAPNGTGKVVANVDILPNANNTVSLGSLTRQWNTVYARNIELTGNLSVADLTVGGNLTVTGNIIEMGNIITDAKTIQLANTANSTSTANLSGMTVGANDNIATFLYNATANAWTVNIGLSATGNVSAPYFIGNGSLLTGVSSYSNTSAAAFLANLGSNSISTTGTVTAGNITITAANVQLAAGTSNTSIYIAPSGSTSNAYVQIPDNQSSLASGLKVVNRYGHVEVSAKDGAAVQTWYFREDGSFELPGDVPAHIKSDQDIIIQSGSGDHWTFGLDNALTTPGNLNPDTSNAYSLGNATNQWSDLWVSNATIYMNSVPIGLTAGNVLTVNGNDVITTNANGTVDLANLAVDNNNIYNTAGQGVVISNFSFIAEAETAYVQIPAGNSASDLSVVQTQGNVRLAANTVDWTFDTSGNLTLPVNGSIVLDGGDGVIGPVSDDMVISWDNEEIRLVSVQGSIEMQADAAFRVQTNYDGGTDTYLSRWEFNQNEIVNITNDFGIVSEVGNLTLSGGRDGVNSGNTTISAVNVGVAVSTWTFDNTGNLTLPSEGNIVGITPNNAGRIQWVGNSSGDGIGYTTLGLIPDDTLVNNDQYLIIDPTAPGHIHIRAGGEQDNSSADLFLGGENSYFKVNAGANNEVRISANSHGWVFGADSVLTVPGEGLIRSIGDVVTLQSYNVGTGNVQSVYLGSGGGLGFFDQDIGGNWLEIFKSGAEPQIRVPVGRGNLNVQTAEGINAYDWVFDNTGNLTAPGAISAVGNVTANYFIGDGSQLTGLPASYSDSNVATFLAAYGSNTISTTGNITAGNFIGNIQLVGNVQGTQANVTLIAGSYSWTFDNTGIASFPAVGGEEGGEINLAIPTANTTLTGPVKVDVYQDRLRFFDGSTNGAYLDLANCPSGVSAAIGYRDIPQISLSANVTANATNAGRHFYSTTAGNLQLTIPDNANVAFPTGATLTIVVNAAGNVIVAQGTGVSLYMAGSSSTGNRTVGAYGLASVMKVATDTWVISGTGVY